MTDPVQQVLDTHPYVWVSNYDASDRLGLIVHVGNYPRGRVDLFAEGCRYFRGALEGGPYRLQLESIASPEGATEVRLFDEGGQFELICVVLRLARREEVFFQVDWP